MPRRVHYVNLSVGTILRHSMRIPDRAPQRIWWLFVVFALLVELAVVAAASERVRF